MRAWHNMPTSEFVGQLRDIAIRANARTAVIDCIDAIVDAPTEDEIEEQCDKAYEEGEQAERTEWCDALQNAIAELADVDLTDSQYQAVLAVVKNIDPVS